VRLYSRPGNDLTRRFPLIVEMLARLRSRSCIIGGEAVACDDNDVASFDFVRQHRANDSIFLYAFDLVELNGDNLRRDPLEVRKATLASIVAKAGPGIRFNKPIKGDGPTVFANACKLGLEGVVSKRKDPRSPDWLAGECPPLSLAGHRVVGIPAPIGSETSAVPADHRLRLENSQCVQYSRSYTIEPRKHQAVNIAERQSLRGFAPQHVELVPKDKDLGFQRSP
jgi:bifunctional non-homologous end joining protein LigD